jgi:hypothetical protein
MRRRSRVELVALLAANALRGGLAIIAEEARALLLVGGLLLMLLSRVFRRPMLERAVVARGPEGSIRARIANVEDEVAVARRHAA